MMMRYINLCFIIIIITTLADPLVATVNNTSTVFVRWRQYARSHDSLMDL